MKAEHLDEQPSITNTDDKVLSKLSQHWLKIIEGIADTKGGQEALDQYFTNKIKEAELRGRKEHFEEIVPDEGVDEDSKGSFADGYSKAVEDICDAHFARLTQLTNQYKGEQDNE